MLMVGLLLGVMTFSAAVILIEKLPARIRELAFGHYLATDILMTVVSFSIFPVTGAATLINSAFFCLLISAYLSIRRKTAPRSRITFKKYWRLSIERYSPTDEEGGR